MAEINIGCRLVWGDVFLALRLVDLGAGAVGLGIGSDWLGGVFLPPLQDSRTPEYVLRSTYGVRSTERALHFVQAKDIRTFPQLGTKIKCSTSYSVQ